MAGAYVYLSINQIYYAANSPTNPNDEQIPFPTPELLALIAANEPNGIAYNLVNTTVDTLGNGEPANEQDGTNIDGGD